MDDATRIDALRGLLDASNLRERETVEVAKRMALSFTEEDDRAWALSEITKALARCGEWREAEATARTIGMSYEKASAFLELARHLLAADERDRALANLSAAESAADAGETNWVWQRAENYARIGQTFAESGEYDEALRVWDKAITAARTGEEHHPGQDSVDCSGVLWEVAEYLAAAGDIERAAAVAEAIKSHVKRPRAVEAIRGIAAGDPSARHK